jgi:cytochrome c peroxidase
MSTIHMSWKRMSRGGWVVAALCGLIAVSAAVALAARGGKAPDRASLEKDIAKYERPSEVPHPADNAYSPARVELGRRLFFDPRLSGSNWISCGTCHNPGLAWGDGLPKGIGHGMQQLGRRTPTVLNTAWASSLFWDGRAATLEEQALGPITAPGEMNMDMSGMLEKIKAVEGYRDLFAEAYPDEPISDKTVAKAIAAYERTVVSGKAPFDEWVEGDDNALSPAAQRGFVIFNGKGNCAACHSGWRFTDDSFHDIGVPGDDIGRGKFLKLETMQHAFKTPTLRNVDQRAPYMHDGSEATLEEVVELYDVGGRVKRPSLSPEMKPLGLTAAEKRDLVEFLRALTSEDGPVMLVSLPR